MKHINSNDSFAIFGAHGMAGSAICRILDSKDYKRQLRPKRNELDLLDCSAVQRWMVEKKPDIVVLAAAKVGGIYANKTFPADFLLENLKIQFNVIETACRVGVKNFVFLGSSCIYPRNCPQPIKEEYLMTSELESTNEYYAIAKITGIKLCEAYAAQHKFNYISVMPCNLYGPGDNYHPKHSHVMASLLRKILTAKHNNSEFIECWGTGSPLREFLHVDDLAEAIIFLLENHDSINNKQNLFNIGSGAEISIKSLAGKIADQVNYTGNVVWNSDMPDGTPRKLLDSSKINNLGWNASISLDNGIQLVLQDLRSSSQMSRWL